MQLISFLLNLPWTFVGLFMAVLSGPSKIRVHHKPFVIVISVRSFWYRTWQKKMKGVRGCVQGNVMLLGPHILPPDFEHELIHIEQINRQPFVHPILYAIESFRHGYRNNKYEVEAYRRAGNRFDEK